MNKRFESIKQILRRVLGTQRLWAVVAVVAVLLPFVATGVELAKISGQYMWGLILFAAITIVWVVTMVLAMRVPAKPLPQQQPPQVAGQATTQPAQSAQSSAKAQATRAESARKGQQPNQPKARSK